MRSVNKVIIIGNLTRDPEMRDTTNDQKVCTFGVATNREWVNSSGSKQSSTEFHEIVVWGKLAEICAQYLRKSKLVYLEGYLKTRSWETPEGIKRYKTEVVINDMIMLNKRGEVGDDTTPVAAAAAPELDTLESDTTDALADIDTPAEDKTTDTPAEDKAETPEELPMDADDNMPF